MTPDDPDTTPDPADAPPDPAIIARGEWVQDEDGTLTCFPHAYGDTGAPAGRRRGYRIRSDAVWDRARDDYLAGDPAEAVCARHDLALSTFRARAAQEGWRRRDRPDPEPIDLEAERAALPTPAAMADHARILMNRALTRGRFAETAAWLRVLARLEGQDRPRAPTAPGRSPARSRGPDAYTALEQRLRTIEAIGRAAADIADDDLEGQAQIDRLVQMVKDTPMPSISDGSDDSDPVFSAPGSETAPEPSATP